MVKLIFFGNSSSHKRHFFQRFNLAFLIRLGVGVGVFLLLIATLFDVASKVDVTDTLTGFAFWCFLVATIAYLIEVFSNSLKMNKLNDKKFSERINDTNENQTGPNIK